MLLNVISLVASLVALITSSVIAVRQSMIMRHANEVPVLMDAFKEYRSPVHGRHEDYVVNRLASENSPANGISGLPEEARAAAGSIITFFNVLGALLVNNMTDEKVIVPFYAYRIKQAWGVLEPFILRERINRGDDMFASYFEDLVCRARDLRPPQAKRRLRMRSMQLSTEMLKEAEFDGSLHPAGPDQQNG
jgi:hypothetical protein